MIDSAYLLPGQAKPLRIYSKEKAAEQKYDLIPGFIRAKTVERVKHFPPPKLPKDFKPIKIFPPKPIEEGRALLPVSCLYFIILSCTLEDGKERHLRHFLCGYNHLAKSSCFCCSTFDLLERAKQRA